MRIIDKSILVWMALVLELIIFGRIIALPLLFKIIIICTIVLIASIEILVELYFDLWRTKFLRGMLSRMEPGDKMENIFCVSIQPIFQFKPKATKEILDDFYLSLMSDTLKKDKSISQERRKRFIKILNQEVKIYNRNLMNNHNPR